MNEGVKITIIDSMDYVEFKEILDTIHKLGYSILMVDNGNAVCQKGDNDVSDWEENWGNYCCL